MDTFYAVTHIVVGLALIIGTITDLKKREVPDLLNYGLILFGILIRLFYSVLTSDYTPLLEGLLGLGVFFGLSCAMFYTGQWGGGDAKLLMGMGSMLGIELGVFSLSTIPYMALFVVNLLAVGAVYGILWSLVLAIKRFSTVREEYKKLSDTPKIKKLKYVLLAVGGVALIGAFLTQLLIVRTMLLVFAFVIILASYLWLLVKSVEKACMYKFVAPSKLVEGDWIAEDVHYKKKYICGPKDLGIEREQIDLLKKHKIKKVLVRDGIPFVPSFLIGFIVTELHGAWFLLYLFPF